MKNKNSFYFLIAGLISVIILNNICKKQNIKQIKSNISIDQYRNRLKEFFSQDQIDDQMKHFCDFMSNGFKAENAFLLVVQEAKLSGV